MRKIRHVFAIAFVILFTFAFVYVMIYFSAKPATLAGATGQSIVYQHKTIPLVVQKEIIAALSYYPELQNTSINFVFDPNTSKSVMLSQPVLASFFKGKKERAYVVKINPRFVMTHHSIPIQNVPKDILIGWFGHELGHIRDYTERGNWNMIVFGIKYISSDRYLMQAERNADTYAVKHGLGDYILKTKNFILHHADIPEAYKARIKRLYLSPQQIINLVKELKKAGITKHPAGS